MPLLKGLGSIRDSLASRLEYQGGEGVPSLTLKQVR